MNETDFIKLSFANAEANIRSYDTKSQIIVASTALSYNPIFISLRQIDTSAWFNMRIGVVFVLFALMLLMFLRVLAPVSGQSDKLGSAKGNLFFLRETAGMTPDAYLVALRGADLAIEYANEVLALHRIRSVKHRRFRQALFFLIGYALLVLLYGLAVLTRLF